MRDVQEGNLDRRVPVHADDEVGRLSQGFNRMLDQLSAADREIRAFNQRLAEEVASATRDLSRKNLALAQLNRLLNDLRRENASKVRLAALGQLAAQLAHEIGTPLSSVSGHLQLALLQRDLAPALRERLEVATREIARIGRIVRDYLDSTRSLEPERKDTSLRRVLEEALDAVDSSGRVKLTGRSAGDDVVITVADTGGGIAPDDLRRIFEPFYTTKGRGKGTGLGLAICRELVAALGGAITVESAPGAGSTFTVRLPRRGPPQGGEAARAPTPAAAAGSAA
jgi:signal transduction histidine kinase